MFCVEGTDTSDAPVVDLVIGECEDCGHIQVVHDVSKLEATAAARPPVALSKSEDEMSVSEWRVHIQSAVKRKLLLEWEGELLNTNLNTSGISMKRRHEIRNRLMG